MLSKGLFQLFNFGKAKPISYLLGYHPPTHTLYADDAFLYDYECASEQMVSKEKSSFFASSINHSWRLGIKNTLEF